jgi:hypothetical protein
MSPEQERPQLRVSIDRMREVLRCALSCMMVMEKCGRYRRPQSVNGTQEGQRDDCSYMYLVESEAMVRSAKLNPAYCHSFPRTLARPADASRPTPSCIACVTGRMGAESNTCGHGCGSGAGGARAAPISRSYIDGCRGERASASYSAASNVCRAPHSRCRTYPRSQRRVRRRKERRTCS